MHRPIPPVLRRALLHAAALACICALALAPCLGASLRVVYPRPAADNDQRGAYYVKLLELVMNKSGAHYAMRPYARRTVGARLYQSLASEDGIDVSWFPTTVDLERTLTAVRIPIDKGMLGWRLLLIKAPDQRVFTAVRSLDQLKNYAAGQVRDWPDSAILRANGLPVIDAVLYDGLFQMLAAGRFQYVPRGVGEIWGERRNVAALGLDVEQHLALHYPSYTYFFVSQRNRALAAALERGLRTAQKDGSFDRLFERYNGALIRQARLETRRVFELRNPLLPADTPSWPPSTWIHP